MTKRDNEIPILTTPEHLELGIFAIEKVEKEIQIALPYMKAQLAKYNADLAEHYKKELDGLTGANQIAVPTPPNPGSGGLTSNLDTLIGQSVGMPEQSIMERHQAAAVAEEDADDQIDNFFHDIAIVMNRDSCLSDEMRAAIKNAIDDHGVEFIFHSAEKI